MDAVAHEEEGDALVVIIRSAVAGAGAAFGAFGGVFGEPVGLLQDEEIAAASGEIVEGEGGAGVVEALGGREEIFGAIDGGDAGHGGCGFEDGAHGLGIVFEAGVASGGKVDVVADDAGDGGFGIVEGFERSFDAFLEFGY